MQRTFLIVLIVFTCLTSTAQNHLYKGNNVLLPQNLVVNYSIPLRDYLDIDNCPNGQTLNKTDSVSVELFFKNIYKP